MIINQDLFYPFAMNLLLLQFPSVTIKVLKQQKRQANKQTNKQLELIKKLFHCNQHQGQEDVMKGPGKGQVKLYYHFSKAVTVFTVLQLVEGLWYMKKKLALKTFS